MSGCGKNAKNKIRKKKQKLRKGDDGKRGLQKGGILGEFRFQRLNGLVDVGRRGRERLLGRGLGREMWEVRSAERKEGRKGPGWTKKMRRSSVRPFVPLLVIPSAGSGVGVGVGG